MCGFAGFFPSFNDNRNYKIIKDMLLPIKYRGPDDTDIFINNKITLGHHRLSIISLEGGKQPCYDRSSGDCLVFNGEIYDYKKHRKTLLRNNISLIDDSDTEVLFKFLINFGIKKTLSLIDGMFAFVFYKSKSNTIYLARDRSGEKPLFYSIFKNRILFGSEIKTISCFPSFKSVVNLSSIYSYLNLDYIPFENTLLQNINKVSPGHYVKYDHRSLSKHRYWKLNTSLKSELSFENSLHKLDYLLNSSVKTRLVADVPVGLFLSGGIDSSLIAYYAKKFNNDITTFTVKFSNQSYDESYYARIVSEHLGLKNQSISISNQELLNSLDSIENNIDEPINDPSIIPTYLISKFAKESVKVVLSGDGADELFSGYAPFKYIFLLKFLRIIPKSLGNAIYSYSSKLKQKDSYMSFRFLLKQVSKGFGYKSNEQIFRWMSSFSERDIKQLFHSKCYDFFSDANVIKILGSKYGKKTKNLHDQISLMFYENYLPEDILMKVDRASMYNSLEVRSPFLDKDIVKFAFSIKNNYKIQDDNKYILRKLSSGKLPNSIVKRKKHGFALPIGEMLRTSLRDRVTDNLLSESSSISSIFNKKYVEKLLYEHGKGRDHKKKIWAIYILEKCLQNIAKLN